MRLGIDFTQQDFFRACHGQIGHPLTQGFPLNNLDQLFLTDRPRWREKEM